MNITINGRKVSLKDNFKERVEKKLSKFDKIFGDKANANVTVTLEKNRQTVEVTIRHNGVVYRAENTCDEMNEALDNVVDIIAGQIRKNKSKLEKRFRSNSISEYLSDENFIEEHQESEYKIVKSKQFPVKPLDIEEAILQMNLIGHQFFMFRNFDTNEVNVVYRRKNGTYGLLEPELN